MTLRTVLDEMPARLRDAAGNVETTKKAAQLAVRLRNRLIVEAVDAGMPQQIVARIVGVTQPHVVRVLARSAEDDEP